MERTYHGSKRGLEGAIRADRGKIANDRIFNTVQAFFRGELTDVALVRSLRR